MAVVFFHCYIGPFRATLDRTLPHFATAILAAGWLGVPLFFIISGYVISLSLFGRERNVRTSSRFLAKRIVRLSPPYLLAILVVVLDVASVGFRKGDWHLMPSVGNLLAHATYLQGILGTPEFLPVAWTLCIEVQFYLAFALLCVLMGFFPTKLQDKILIAFCLMTFIPSLFFGHAGWTGYRSPYLWNYWYMFVLGMIAYWLSNGKLPLAILLIAAAVSAVVGIYRRETAIGFSAVFALLIYCAAKDKPASRIMRHPILLMLGAISYSLYLVHWVVVYRILNLAGSRNVTSFSIATAWCLIACVASVGFAYLFWHVIERPSIRWSQRISLRQVAPRPPRTANGPMPKRCATELVSR